ncbi:efflux RND transporter periplasmic adaptor subunit [Paenibacillus sp. CF384]|uniref:efflux RND transporter periplasmic adaptor subunit n=1 Tax=Paenibacillus sp. CF384 TaxID=1884382 RepID=UPI00089A956A|nr:efflux RND transporter periplasmic adaptor subunit [Paenibacillus sp. CF384]SDW66252.1 RND family efflux transporter, MFP subunit [Paenibacillus sp. CF384]
MSTMLDDNRLKRRKRLMGTVLILFFGALAVLTFFSNTIAGMALPKVTVTKPDFGQLERTVSGEGELEAEKSEELYAEGDGNVTKIYVEEGDAVKKGQTLISYDTTEAKRNLTDEETRYAQAKLRMEKQREGIVDALRQGNESSVRDLKRDLKIAEYDLDIQRRKLETMREDIASSSAVRAPFDGIVTKLQATEGLPSSRGQAVVELADVSEGLIFTFTDDADDADKLRIGETVSLSAYIGEKRKMVKGTVDDIEDATDSGALGGGGSGDADDEQKKITVKLTGQELQLGDQVKLSVKKTGRIGGIILASDTVQQGSEGYYVWVVKEKKGPLGSIYTAVKAAVTIGDSDETNTEIVDGIMPDEKVVDEMSEPLSEDQRVRLN